MNLCFVLGLEALVSRVESSVGNKTSLHRLKKRVYSPRNRLRREMVRGHPVLELGAICEWVKHRFTQIVFLYDLSSLRVNGEPRSR